MQGSYNNFADFSAEFSASREKLEMIVADLISPEFAVSEHGKVCIFLFSSALFTGNVTKTHCG